MYEYAFNFVINFLNILLLGILYNAIVHKCRFGQAYCIYLLERILQNLLGIFLSFIRFSMNFRNLYKFLEL
jgi:hypothetical protein